MYFESQLDRDNRAWFLNDKTVNSLFGIGVANGHIRGVYTSSVEFQYPISAFVGENGSGKSTFLALIACAFHNTTGFCPQNRVRPGKYQERLYYTYGDFFTFLPSENGISEIQIQSEYLSSTGTKIDIRKKKPSGKWNDYNRRPSRVVSFLGINRIVPPSESNPHRHYSKMFSPMNILSDNQINELRMALSQIFDKNYDKLELMGYGHYKLFTARRNGTRYTGFNMGAGENAVLGLLFEIFTAGRGALIVVDEIELGLHAKAQSRLINVLKQLCKKNHCQIICSTHSKVILDALPREARFFIKRNGEATDIIQSITSEYAFGQLAGCSSAELSVFVEDSVAKAFLQNVITCSLRERLRIIPIGSDQAILRQMAAYYREKNYSFIAFLDGDKRREKDNEIRQIEGYLESQIDHSKQDFLNIMSNRLQYLPGNVWPERYLVEETLRVDSHDELCAQWGTDESNVKSVLAQALNAEKHSEFHYLSLSIQLDEGQIRTDLIRFYGNTHKEEVLRLETEIRGQIF